MSEQRTYDAIVVGSGISGGWAAKELCEKGLKTLVLERGRMVKHLKDYPGMNNHPWEFKHRGAITHKQRTENPLISKAAGYAEDTQHFFIKDADHPYVQEKPFEWIRGYQVGGKSLTWGRSCQRWSDYEFNAPKQYGFAVDWPIRYKDIAPWYSHVEKFVGICGNKDNIAAMPDGEFLPAYELNCVEKHMQQQLWEKWQRHLISGRWAHLTEPAPIHQEQGRGSCQNRNLCMRGCPFGGYFSSNSSTLPWAEKTGNLTIRPDSVVHSILYDEQQKKAIGVRVIDAVSKQQIDYFASLVFLNASALNTNLILLNSRSKRFPNGLGNDHDLLGRFICFHNYRGYMNGEMPGFETGYYKGRRPAECVIPNFRNLGKKEMDFLGGYVIFTGAYRPWTDAAAHPGKIGAELKETLTEPGPWRIYMYMQGETIPKASNRVYLHPTEKDAWGIPLLVTDVSYDENDEKMLQDFLEQGKLMLESMGVKNLEAHDSRQAPGLDIHEMGGVRMGKDPSSSLLNEWNQLHLCKNVFVTDGACMTSTGNQSPSILYMAFAARAVQHAVEELKKGNL
ncbi:GMC family oxidoreductase [Flavihumibacter sp. CACIAM 22H1]|uniref:GMC oxidoreductase n=1 Tax=Flavihumibacter sp. CACIAM 22H1 TaxID=1812911 RepID=UPI0007A8DD0B|nr:GMC family oxidoreductase [Flavihumibacter sp. CACIAM 22H1]KYP15658.1 MAG: GMC family oxidoreductase [Flavihumibacter sp. CACIAM 22H1]